MRYCKNLVREESFPADKTIADPDPFVRYEDGSYFSSKYVVFYNDQFFRTFFSPKTQTYIYCTVGSDLGSGCFIIIFFNTPYPT